MPERGFDRSHEERAFQELDSLSNWNRWGSEDERGALNWVTPAAVMRGVGSVKTGTTYSLGNPIGPSAPASAGIARPIHRMTRDAGDAALTGDASSDHYSLDGLQLDAIHEVTTHID